MGLANATGRYFKVVDSDDWLDEHAMAEIMVYLRRQEMCIRDSPSTTRGWRA